MKLSEVVQASVDVASTRSRNAKTERLAALLDRRDNDTLRVVVPWLAGELRQGRIGVGYAALSQVRATPPRADGSLTVQDVDDAVTAISKIAGTGSKARRAAALAALLGAATRVEQGFLIGLLAGELRQGALAGVMSEAVAKASGVPAGAVRRAAMLSGDLVGPALAAFTGGEEALDAFRLQVGRPVQPMLAQTADGPGDALGRLDDVRFEAKLDGARIQVHRQGDRVDVFSRTLKHVTRAVPEVVAAVQALPGGDLVLDGEVIAIQPDGRPHAFQTTMRRFGRKLDVAALQAELPLTSFFFDVLHAGGSTWVDRPLIERGRWMQEHLPEDLVVPMVHDPTEAQAEAFLEQTLAQGHEGVMAKAGASAYEAGSRGAAWLKIKPSWTVDLVVLAVEWGSGRRKGWLSNLHLGARDPGTGGFVMLGKTFKGLTDQLLAWQTEQLLAREVRRDGHVVVVRPELVVEIAFNDVQTSSRYPGGLALRFARVKGYRPDKTPAEADTLATIRAIHAGAALRTASGRPRATPPGG